MTTIEKLEKQVRTLRVAVMAMAGVMVLSLFVGADLTPEGLTKLNDITDELVRDDVKEVLVAADKISAGSIKAREVAVGEVVKSRWILAESIVLADENGKPRVMIGKLAKGSYGIAIIDASNSKAAGWVINDEGTQIMSFPLDE